MSSRMLEALKNGEEIQLAVKGRSSGKESSRPVWFVLKEHQLLLLSVKGTRTQWYKNISRDPWIKISIGSETYIGKAQPIRDQHEVSAVVESFRQKYGAGDVKKYYPRLDAAARIDLAM